jgi:hypothetical protein
MTVILIVEDDILANEHLEFILQRSLPTLLRQISVLTYGNLRVPPPAAHGYE